MISKNQLKLIGIVLIIIIISVNAKYFGWLNDVYKSLKRIPKTLTIILAIVAIFSVNYGYLKQLVPNMPDLSSWGFGSNGGDSFDLTNIMKNNFHTTEEAVPDLNVSPDLDVSGQKVKRKVTESTKKLVAARQQWKCGLCGQLLDETYEIDHVVPLYKGGTNEPSNLMALDPICHRKKTNADRLGMNVDSYFNLGPTPKEKEQKQQKQNKQQKPNVNVQRPMIGSFNINL